ncbi:hypothetical protein [Candidatus Spongiihabitans sp.]
MRPAQRDTTAMDGGSADFAGAKICQNRKPLTFPKVVDQYKMLHIR